MLYRHDFNRLEAMRYVFLTACLVLLHACSGTPPTPVVEKQVQPTAEQAYAQGNYAQAARLWQQQSSATSGPAASSLRLRAADAWMLADNVSQAQDNLRQVDNSELSAADTTLMELVQADLALHNDRPYEAEALLRQASAGLPRSLQQRFDQLLQNTQLMLTQAPSHDVSHAVAVIKATSAYEPVQGLQFLHALQDIPSSQLALRSSNPRDDQTTAGWLDLALVVRQNLVVAESVQTNIEAWKSRYPDHYMTTEDALDLWLLYRQEFTSPGKVAVLLPGQGPLQGAAEAMRDGIMTAYIASPGGSELIFLDTGEAGELAGSAYGEARVKGADWIIGPLHKPAIDALLQLADLATPIMALNDLPANFTPPPLLAGHIQAISLSQDQETRAVAREAIRAGYHDAIILAPETEWGERMAQVFREEFLQENRQIVAQASYLESENDHSPTLEHLLEIDESKARKLQVENSLQMKLEFEPVRRNDVDMLFLVASSSQGRSIRPQLRFLDAGDIPVYSTGRIFTGRRDPAGDQDLNGIRFPITPLQLHRDSKDPAPELASVRAGSFTPLYALGQDAWNMLPWLELMKRDPDFRFPGASGVYRSGPAGELYREPAFALFIRGVPARLNPATVDADTGDNN